MCQEKNVLLQQLYRGTCLAHHDVIEGCVCVNLKMIFPIRGLIENINISKIRSIRYFCAPRSIIFHFTILFIELTFS